MKPIQIVGGCIMLAMAGCTWVPLTTGGENIRVLHGTDVADCQKLGKTTSKTAARVVIFARAPRKVNEELEFLARNEAAEMGGDAIVPIGTPTDGRQSFEIYRCDAR